MNFLELRQTSAFGRAIESLQLRLTSAEQQRAHKPRIQAEALQPVPIPLLSTTSHVRQRRSEHRMCAEVTYDLDYDFSYQKGHN